MADRSKIQWTDASWNPVRGCSRVSEGCRNCYAEAVAARFSGPGQPYEGFARPNAIGYAGSALPASRRPGWTGKVALVPAHLRDPLRWTKPRRVFVNSMSDLFHEALSDDSIAAVFAAMAAADQHTFQVLTKRPERMRDWFRWVSTYDEGSYWTVLNAAANTFGMMGAGELPGPLGDEVVWPLPNVWLGVSVEDQATADERIPLLLKVPAAIRFVSYEPALGPVGFENWIVKRADDRPRLDWIIVGGESGPGARPFDVGWARVAIEQGRDNGVPVFVKQLGKLPATMHRHEAEPTWHPKTDPNSTLFKALKIARGGWPLELRHPKGGDPSEWPEDLRVREFPFTPGVAK